MSAVDWREEALIARAALYLLKVATARPDLPRLDAWIRAHAEVTAVMGHGVRALGCDCGAQWDDLVWRHDTLVIMVTDHSAPDAPALASTHWRIRRSAILALLDGP